MSYILYTDPLITYDQYLVYFSLCIQGFSLNSPLTSTIFHPTFIIRLSPSRPHYSLSAFPRSPEAAHTYSRHSPRGRQDNHSDTSCITPTLDGNHRPSDLFIDPVQMSHKYMYIYMINLYCMCSVRHCPIVK